MQISPAAGSMAYVGIRMTKVLLLCGGGQGAALQRDQSPDGVTHAKLAVVYNLLQCHAPASSSFWRIFFVLLPRFIRYLGPEHL